MRRAKRRADGNGTVYNEGKGRWRAAIVIDGKTIRRRAKTEKEAKALLADLIKQRDQGLDIQRGTQTLQEWCEFWFATILPGKHVKPRTLQGHRYIVEHYVLPYLGKLQLAKLTAQHIDTWQAKLRNQGLATGTITNARRRLSTVLEIARKRHLVAENVVSLTEPIREPTRRKEEGIDYLNEEQIKRLLQQLQQEGHRLYALYAIACTLGLRQAELMGLRWSSLNLTEGTLLIKEQLHRIAGKSYREKSTKGGKARTIHLTASHITLLKQHQAQQAQEKEHAGELWQGEDLIFVSEDGTPLEGGALTRQFKRALARSGLPNVPFHSLRHSAGSIMLANGAELTNVSKILGHAHPGITARIYSHSFEEGERKAVEISAKTLLDGA